MLWSVVEKKCRTFLPPCPIWRHWAGWKGAAAGCIVLLLAACSHTPAPRSAEPFTFKEDSFAFANELVWEYTVDPNTGKMRHSRRQPPPTYTHHCFVVARSARQFFNHARFEPDQPRREDAYYRRAIREVVNRNPRRVSPPEERVIFPGFHHLREFSALFEADLKAEAGPALQSYFQRGHWRMVFPFTRKHQQRTAESLHDAVRQMEAPVVHLVTFPQLSINHAVLLFASREVPEGYEFQVYDPNHPEQPTQLTFRSHEGRFHFPANDYFKGGPVDVYQVYHSTLY